ncbi:MAG: hypothetical protein LC130_23365 [Bryobacterales bacterium]|nr:hypothetical protein [Bryobacterales bacterium]
MTHLFTEFDDLSGLKKQYHYQDGKLIERTEQYVEPILDYAAALRNAEEYKRQGIKNSLWHAAVIPPIVALKWLNEHGFNMMTASAKEVARFIERNPDYHYLKTTTGRIA